MAMVNLLRALAAMPVFVSADAQLVQGTASTMTFNLTGVAVGDLMIVATRGANAGWSSSTPTGWVQLRADTDSSNSGQVFYRVADISDGATPSVTVSYPANYFLAGVAFAYRGATTIAASGWGRDLSFFKTTLPLIAPDVTAPSLGRLVCVWASDNQAITTITPPVGMTSRASAAAAFNNVTGADEAIGAAGATGTRTATDGSQQTGESSYSLFLTG